MPIYASLAMVGFFAALGLPGMSGFVSEVMVFLGAYKAQQLITALATIGVVFTAGYILWAIQRVFLGKLKPEAEGYKDLNIWEYVTLVPLAAAAIILGVFPSMAIDIFKSSTDLFVNHLVK
jgi:NADH-quinone oxidoreductase subunit M